MNNLDHTKFFAVVTFLVTLFVIVIIPSRGVTGYDHNGFSSIPTDPFAVTPSPPAPTPAPTIPPEFPMQAVLQYISKRENVSLDQLQVVHLDSTKFGLIGQEFWFAKIEDYKSEAIYGVLVNMKDHSFVDDIEDLRAAERAARWDKYGKFNEELNDRLSRMAPDEKVSVIISLRVQRRGDEELFAELAAKYPKAREALDRTGNPFEVDDPELNNLLENEYAQLIEDDLQAQVQPVVDHLEVLGYSVTRYPGMPALAATLPKIAILDLAQRPDVVALFLAEDQEVPELDTAVPSNRAPAVWNKGYDGTGVKIGIVEKGKVDFDGPAGHNYLKKGEVRNCNQTYVDHKTRVASCAASYHDTFKGMAFQATINDACTDGSQADQISALSWATTNSEVINTSVGFEVDNDMHPIDWAYDYWARHGFETLTKSAGNTGGSLSSPAKAFNVITVGGSDNEDTSNWSDDRWWDGSSYINPSSREKPEVVAPADDISAIARDNAVTLDDGTSYAAPQVAGLAALLMDRNTLLLSAPNAVKAIIMASALQNIECASRLSDKDGAGAIDAFSAYSIASNRGSEGTTACIGPCWWSTYITPSNLPDNTFLNRYFLASKGEKIRIVIAWWSYAYCTDLQNCDYDFLSTDLDLKIYDPNGTQVASSVSSVNNFEIVEFMAPKTGQYRIGVYRFSLTLPPVGEASNYVGIAWVKDATYLPDLRNKDGLLSEIHMRNDGAVARSVEIHYFDINGNPTPKGSDVCNLSPNQWCWIPVDSLNRIPAGTIGSAIVAGAEDVSVVVRQRDVDNSPEVWATYNGSTQAASEAFAPLLHRNNSSWYRDLFI